MKFHYDRMKILYQFIRDSIKKTCLYISASNEVILEQNCRFFGTLSSNDKLSLRQAFLFEGYCLIECANEDEAYSLYKQIDGEDTGGKMYAEIIGANGKPITENT